MGADDLPEGGADDLSWMDEDELILLQNLEAEAAEKAELEQALAISASEAAETAEKAAIEQAIAASVEDAELARTRFEAHGQLARDVFVPAVLRLLKLAIDGLAGCLHSLRSLRNLELQRVDGDQNVAGRHVAEVTARLAPCDACTLCWRALARPTLPSCP